MVMFINGKSFILYRDDVHKITHEQERLLIGLADDDSIGNPLYVSISEDGMVLVDLLSSIYNLLLTLLNRFFVHFYKSRSFKLWVELGIRR